MQLSISPHEVDLLVGVRVIGLGLGKGLGLGLGLGLELWLTRLEADIWLQFEAHQSGAGMLLASMTVERFHSRRGVAQVGHLRRTTSKDLIPKALRRMCEPLDRRQGGRAPRPALAYQHHFGGAAADRREERKEHLKLHVASSCVGSCGPARRAGGSPWLARKVQVLASVELNDALQQLKGNWFWRGDIDGKRG